MTHDIEDFQVEVVEASRERPVVVDFWAEWCGPCRILGPILEKLAAEDEGRWRLAKVDTEQFPDEAARYGVRGIPNVKLFVDGVPVDEFVGALPEAQVRQWLDRAVPSDADRSALRALEEARSLAAEGLRNDARTLLEESLVAIPGHPGITLELARLILFDDPDQAKALLSSASSTPEEEAEVLRQLADLLAGSRDPDDPSGAGRLDTAIERLRAWAFDAAFEEILAVLREESGEGRDRAAKLATTLFRYLGASHPSVVDYRTEVANALYR